MLLHAITHQNVSEMYHISVINTVLDSQTTINNYSYVRMYTPYKNIGSNACMYAYKLLTDVGRKVIFGNLVAMHPI